MSHVFADFLEQLQAEGQLVRCDRALAPGLELGTKAAEAFPQAMLATGVSGTNFPLVTGVFSSQERIVSALRASSVAALAARLGELLEAPDGTNWLDRLGGGRAGGTRKHRSKMLRTGPAQQVVHLGADVDLAGLPATSFHPGEGFPALTAGRLIAGDLGGELHVGRYDFRVLDSNRLVACWPPSSEAWRILHQCRRQGRSMDVAIALGGDPADLLAAMAPLPPGVDVMELSGKLRGSPCELIPARRSEIPVPADAELILEGRIDPTEAPSAAGCGLDGMGQLRPLRDGPLVHVEALTQRPTALFPSLLPEEKSLIHRTLVKVFLPFLRRDLPGLVDLALPRFGGDGVWAYASIDKVYEGQAAVFAHAFWALASMHSVRYLVIVDEDVDVDNSDEVWRAAAAHAAPASDVRVDEAPPDIFVDDPPPGRMVFDATRPPV